LSKIGGFSKKEGFFEGNRGSKESRRRRIVKRAGEEGSEESRRRSRRGRGFLSKEAHVCRTRLQDVFKNRKRGKMRVSCMSPSGVVKSEAVK